MRRKRGDVRLRFLLAAVVPGFLGVVEGFVVDVGGLAVWAAAKAVKVGKSKL
jgi:hypothetical protein